MKDLGTSVTQLLQFSFQSPPKILITCSLEIQLVKNLVAYSFKV